MNQFQSDTALNNVLLEQAEQFCAELLDHPVLSHYRDEIAIVLKGSTAHGYSDRYSDVDLVVFCHERHKQAITDEYVRAGLSSRTDGVFLPLHDWAGHYNTDTYEKLAEICSQSSTEYLWEYSGSKILHDPQGIFGQTVKTGLENFQKKLPRLTKESYLNCQLQLDWLRQPLRRADYGAAMLYAANVYAGVCQTLFLLNGKPYPCQKWLPYYFLQLPLANSLREKVQSFPGVFAQMHAHFTAGLNLMECPAYKDGFEIIAEIKKMLREKYGDMPWIDEWYLYV